MKGIEFIEKLLNERVMLGEELKLRENLSIIPVYKLKINTINLDTEIKNTMENGSLGGVVVSPICVLKILDNDVSVVNLEPKQIKNDMFDFIPTLFTNVNISDIIKSIKV